MTIKPEDIVDDDKLTFEEHVNKPCRSGSCQLKAIFRKSFLSCQAKKF